jgi:hypothetical protein
MLLVKVCDTNTLDNLEVADVVWQLKAKLAKYPQRVAQ